MASNYTRRINLYINGKEIKNELSSIKGEMNKISNAQAHMAIGRLPRTLPAASLMASLRRMSMRTLA